MCLCVRCIEWRWIMTKVQSVLLDSLEMSMCTHLALSISECGCVCIFSTRLKFYKQIGYSASVFLVIPAIFFCLTEVYSLFMAPFCRVYTIGHLCIRFIACQTFGNSYKKGYVKSVDFAICIFISNAVYLFQCSFLDTFVCAWLSISAMCNTYTRRKRHGNSWVNMREKMNWFKWNWLNETERERCRMFYWNERCVGENNELTWRTKCQTFSAKKCASTFFYSDYLLLRTRAQFICVAFQWKID